MKLTKEQKQEKQKQIDIKKAVTVEKMTARTIKKSVTKPSKQQKQLRMLGKGVKELTFN